ncbi:MAG: hypothetical protein EOP85_02220 [Verrucomicrobiaceae bacterium]|nr:MAG: hypothetical protein EOP85_02220 [Verrucomicrobiaceae bacterium]
MPQRPGRVLVVGGLFSAAGGLVLCKVLWELFHNRLSLDQNRLSFVLLVLMRPQGIGLLKGRTSSKWSATLGLIFCYGMCLVFIMMDLTGLGQATLKGFGYQIEEGYSRSLLFSSVIVTGGVFMVMHYLLASRKSAEYFRQHRLRDLKERRKFRRTRGD